MGKAHFMGSETRLQSRNLSSGFSRFAWKVSKGKVLSLGKKNEKKITEPLPCLTITTLRQCCQSGSKL